MVGRREAGVVDRHVDEIGVDDFLPCGGGGGFRRQAVGGGLVVRGSGVQPDGPRNTTTPSSRSLAIRMAGSAVFFAADMSFVLFGKETGKI